METDFFVFSLNETFALPAEYVTEVFALPELILIPDAPFNLVGALNLRGEVLPVVDFRSGNEDQPQRYRLTDSIVVVQQGETRVGVVACAVHELRSRPRDGAIALGERDISADLRACLGGVMQEGEEAVFLLKEPQQWFNKAELQQFISVTSFLISDRPSTARDPAPTGGANAPDAKAGFGGATAAERATFRERADELRRSPVEEQPADEVRTLAVVSIEGQLFGIDSETIREFITVRDAVPVPCCPPHIVGNINFRGEILTVVDIRKALKLPPSELPSSPRAIVAECGELAVGIVVSTIHDAMFLVSLSDITVVSADLSLRSPYTIGTARYNGQTIAILDLLALLQDEQVVVNQAA